MSNIIETVLLSLTLLVSFMAYVAMMSYVLPRFVLRVSYNVKPLLGRGLKKFEYPEGRAVLYEPQPSVRKYIGRYLLFTNSGYKYIQLMLGRGVRDYTASVVMLNNRNKVLGTLVLRELTGGALRSRAVRLHDETSYVAISVSRVNDSALPEPKYAYTKLLWALLYFAAVSLVSFLLFWHMHYTADEIFHIFGGRLPRRVGMPFFVLPSLFIGLSSLGIMLGYRIKMGIRVGLR